MRSFPLLLVVVLFICHSNYLFAQSQNTDKDYKCYDKKAYTDFDLLRTTRTYGDYDVDDEWSERLTSNEIFKKNVELEGGRMYVILLASEENVAATGLEILDSEGIQLEYIYKITDLDNNQIAFFYTPGKDDVYQLFFRVVNPHKASTCAYMAILKGEIDPLEGIQE